jgi:metallophosphoesterase (TIGR00282 family)
LPNNIKILMLGDVVGRPGRQIVKKLLPKFKINNNIDFVVANGENSSGGFGIKQNSFNSLKASGVDVVTSGNHIWNKKEVFEILNSDSTLIRPANYPKTLAGKGSVLFQLKNGIKIGVINILGRVFMPPVDSPFVVVEKEINLLNKKADIIIVDFHAEATSEKEAMGFFLRNKVSLLVGTHTHIQTNDAKIFPEGLGYITDLGRCGSFFSTLGMKYDASLKGFLTYVPHSLSPEKKDLAMEGILATINVETKKTVEIKNIRLFAED